MSKTNSHETQYLDHIFTNAAIAKVGDATGLPAAATVGNLYIRLYTDAVTVDDATIGTEAAYTGYVAGGVAVARSGAGWTVAGNNVSNAAVITFGAATAGTETLKWFAIWKDNVSVLDSERLFWGLLTSTLAVSTGITPEFAIGAISITED